MLNLPIVVDSLNGIYASFLLIIRSKYNIKYNYMNPLIEWGQWDLNPFYKVGPVDFDKMFSAR